ncbi:C40 family peptidase [Corynebacterium sp. H113]|uniref:C40 family peptidase n=1 Tax=Corynebacterium sp. H113 TaxID=3133419 RepID=UPI0030956884
MGMHSRRSKIARNAAVFSATIAGVTALVAPAASANPLAQVPGLDMIPGAQQVVDQFGQYIPQGDIASQIPASAQLPGAQQGFEQVNNFVGNQADVPSVGGQSGVVAAARSQIGTPYVWGGTQPGGFDCSGLTQWSYSQVGKSIPRTSQQQASSGAPVAFGAKQPGDIISFYSGASHVGIYSGGENVIHAPTEGDVVQESPISYMPVNNVVRF